MFICVCTNKMGTHIICFLEGSEVHLTVYSYVYMYMYVYWLFYGSICIHVHMYMYK